MHADKLTRLGVPIYTSHTVISAEGDGKLERITTAALDESYKPVEGISQYLGSRYASCRGRSLPDR